MDYDKDELNGSEAETLSNGPADSETADSPADMGMDVIPVPETEIPPALETYSMEESSAEADRGPAYGTAAGTQGSEERDGARGSAAQGQTAGAQGQAPSGQGYAPNAQGQAPAGMQPQAPPSQGYTPNAQGQAPSGQGYAQPQAPTAQGCAPSSQDPNSGYRPYGAAPQNGGAPQNYPAAPQGGCQTGGPYQYQTQPQPQKNGMAIASLVMGILSLLCCCCGYVGIAFGALGIIFALLSKKDEPMCGQAKTGLILSIIGLAITVASVVIMLIMYAAGLLAEGVY